VARTRPPWRRLPGDVGCPGQASSGVGLRMQNLGRMTRQHVLSVAGATTLLMLLRASAPRTAAAAAFDVTEKSLTDLQAAMTSGQISSVDLVHAYLERIAAYDQQGSALNAVLYLNPNAVQMAADLDAERSSRGARGPLPEYRCCSKTTTKPTPCRRPARRWRCAARCPRTTRFRLANCATPALSCLAKSTCTSSPSG
jgi:hypothetical protein